MLEGRLTSKLNSKTIPVLLSLDPSHIFTFHLLPSPVHLTEFSSCFSSDSLQFLSHCYRTKTTIKCPPETPRTSLPVPNTYTGEIYVTQSHEVWMVSHVFAILWAEYQAGMAEGGGKGRDGYFHLAYKVFRLCRNTRCRNKTRCRIIQKSLYET